MAVRAACASTAFLTATTWATVDTSVTSGTSATYLANETTGSVTTSEAGNRAASGFTPGAITIDGIGLRVSSRLGTTGTFSVQLFNLTDTAVAAGTLVTVNMTDFPNIGTGDLSGGWQFFKFSAPVTLTAGKAYVISPVTSNSTQLVLMRDATSNNWSRYLRTTTTGAPAAGDDLIIAGEWTAAATVTTRTVTMDETAATDYGSAPTAASGLLSPGIAIGEHGVLTYGTTAATNYVLRLSNSLIVYNGGTLNIGTTGTPVPRDGSSVLEFDLAADGDYGLVCRNGSTVNLQGLSRTSGKNIVSCKLNTDEAIASTSLGVDTDTGWLDNDQIAVASTTRTAADCEAGLLNGAAGAGTLTVDGFAGAGGGLAVAHSGTSPTQAEVILLTRNVKVRSTSSTLMSYVNLQAGSIIDIDWAEFHWLGITGVAGKRGVEVEVNTTGATNFSMQFSSIHDTEANGFYVLPNATAGTLTSLVFSSNTMWNLATTIGPGCQIFGALTATGWTFDSNILIRTGNGNGWTLSDVGGTFTNNTVVGTTSVGISYAEAATLGTISGNITHSSGSDGVQFGTALLNGTVSTIVSWRNSSAGVNFSAAVVDLILDTVTAFGNATNSINVSTRGVDASIKSLTSNGDTSFATTNGVGIAVGSSLLLDNSDFSTVAGIKTAHTNDINISVAGSLARVILRNTKLGASVEVLTPSNLSNNGFIASEKHDQTAGNHMTWMKNGLIQTDASVFNTATPSMLMTPTSATLKLESAPQFQGMKVAVASGATVTIAVYVRKSASYNGNQPRLIQKANPAIGLNADAVIATFSAGLSTWAQISGATAAATDDGVLEFVVDCDGTAGAINVDDWSAS